MEPTNPQLGMPYSLVSWDKQVSLGARDRGTAVRISHVLYLPVASKGGAR